jgi:rRNA-processing protein FCF1
LIEGRGIPDVVSRGSDADTALIEASRLPNVVVATADSVLRRKIRGAGKPVIFLREKAKLELEGIEASYW